MGTTNIADAGNCNVVCQGGYTPSAATALCTGTTLAGFTCNVDSSPGCPVVVVENGAGTGGVAPCGAGIESIAAAASCTMECAVGFTASNAAAACVTGSPLTVETCVANSGPPCATGANGADVCADGTTAITNPSLCSGTACTPAECCAANVAGSSATCAADVCTASSRTPVSATPTCASDPCTVEDCCQAAATTIEVTKVTSTITAGLDFDPSASASAEKVTAFKAGVFLTLNLPEVVTTSMVALSFVAARRLGAHASATTSYTVTGEVTLPAGVTAATVQAAVNGVTQTDLLTNIMAAFVTASLPEPTLTVSAMSDPTTATETVTMSPTAGADEDSGAERSSLFSAVAIALVACAIA